jgi:hypothetical protein
MAKKDRLSLVTCYRVSAPESMLSVCNAETEIESGTPRRPFFANDLN